MFTPYDLVSIRYSDDRKNDLCHLVCHYTKMQENG